MPEKYLLSLIAFLIVNLSSFAQSKPDLSRIHDLPSLKASYDTMKISLEKATGSTYGYLRYDDGSWNQIKFKSLNIWEDHFDMSIEKSSPAFETKKLVDYIEAKYKTSIIKKVGYFTTTYSINNENESIKLQVEKEDNKPIEKDTKATMTITFKPSFSQPYPNIDKRIDQDPNGVFYFVECESFNASFEIYLNGMMLFTAQGEHQFVNEDLSYELNPFILNEGTQQLKIIVKPGYDEAGKLMNTIIKRSYIVANLCEGKIVEGELKCLHKTTIYDNKKYVTDTIKENGETRYSSYPGTYDYGAKQLVKTLSFAAHISYDVNGWKDGNDLRNDPLIKQKVTTLYTKLATAIQNKDEKALNDLIFAQANERAITLYNNAFFGNYTDRWIALKEMLEYANVFKIEKDFKIDFAEDGKLIYASPQIQSDMLRVIGKGSAKGFTYYMYEDKKTNELKFIR